MRGVFESTPLAERVLTRAGEAKSRTGPGRRVCVVCGKKITNYGDYFLIGHLADDPGHPLHRYNYVQAHRTCLPDWADLPSVLELIKGLKLSGTWQGDYLDRLSAELKRHSQTPPTP
jgi:hypothetical protein